jgi:hypothetical protein
MAHFITVLKLTSHLLRYVNVCIPTLHTSQCSYVCIHSVVTVHSNCVKFTILYTDVCLLLFILV